MKKQYWYSAAILGLLLAVVLAYCCFSVDGAEIKEIEAVTVNYTATVVKTHGTLQQQQTEYTLTPQQIQQIKDLIQSSRFTRKLSSGFHYKGLKDIYRITLEYRDSQGRQLDFLSLYCVEDQYLMIMATSPDSRNHHLLIRNANWHNSLESILQTSNKNGRA